MSPRDQRLLLLSAAITSVVLLASVALGQEELVAYAIPLLVLALPLLGGRYPGEQRIVRAAGRRRLRRVRPPVITLPGSWLGGGGGSVQRSGRLLARASAERPPPAAAFA